MPIIGIYLHLFHFLEIEVDMFPLSCLFTNRKKACSALSYKLLLIILGNFTHSSLMFMGFDIRSLVSSRTRRCFSPLYLSVIPWVWVGCWNQSDLFLVRGCRGRERGEGGTGSPLLRGWATFTDFAVTAPVVHVLMFYCEEGKHAFRRWSERGRSVVETLVDLESVIPSEA